MPIVSAVCPSCGGQLEVDNGKEAGICKFCGNAFITEKAINNYNIKYEIKADTIVMNNKASMEELLEREAIYRKIFDGPHLEQVYEDMAKLYPKRHEGWWGKILLLTNGFTDLNADMQQVAMWFGLVCESAPEKVLPALEKQYHSYILNRMKCTLADKEAQLKTAEQAHELELARFRDSLRGERAVAVHDLFHSLFLLAVIAGCWLGIRKICMSVFAGEDPDAIFVFVLIALFGFGISAIVKLLKVHGIIGMFLSFLTNCSIRKERTNNNENYEDSRKKAIEGIESFKKAIENYAQTHGINQ